ncbi:major facilitator superfamily domain-containing protein [Cyathus striatus]|nr:major facilitator superfamily domain-containing protein [Cyathus striatus]
MSSSTPKPAAAARSRSHASRHGNPMIADHPNVPYVPQPEGMILPDGQVGEEALNESLIGEEEEDPLLNAEMRKRASLPWWKRPSPWWLLGVLPLTAIATSATIAPKIEIYTMLVCSVHKPDIFKQNFPNGGLGGNIDVASALLSSDMHRNTSMGMGIKHVISSFTGANETVPLPSKPNLCASDPVVQAAVAQLSTVITTSMGILSCLTTGWWGAFSDRHGRTRVMGISIIGLLFTEWNFIFVTLFSKHIPGGYWFLVVGAIIEGTLGGMTTGVAAMHAYLADTSTESTRSRVFSLGLGLMFTGMALGPTLGGLFIRFTGTTLSVFYATASLHMAYTLLVWTVFPESLSKVHRDRSKTKGGVGLMKRVFGFLTPLAVFSPSVDEVGTNPLKGKKRDWNLMLMALAYGFTLTLMGSYTPKFQYASAMFGWTSETLGYWLSLIGAARALFLAIILPITIKLFKPKPVTIEFLVNSSSETEPLLSPTSSEHTPPKMIRKEIHSPAFDLNLARASLLIDALSYAFMGLTRSPIVFTCSSVTLALYSRRGGTESGKLFGAMSVVQALCSQIIGPSLYGLVYMKTVATLPRAIFVVSVVSVFTGFIMLTLVRLPRDVPEIHPLEGEDIEEPGPVGGTLVRDGVRIRAGSICVDDDAR